MSAEVSTCGDMYSFGILMLEMLTGRRPTDEAFEDGQNLHNFVATSFPDNLKAIMEPHLISRDVEVAIEYENRENFIPSEEECLVSLFRIGLICSMESPKERMNIMEVTKELSIIRKAYFAGEIIDIFLSSFVDSYVITNWINCLSKFLACKIQGNNELLLDLDFRSSHLLVFEFELNL